MDGVAQEVPVPARRHPIRQILAVLVVAFAAAHAQAGDIIVLPVSASTTMGSGLATNLVNTINGAGLTSFPSLTATHSLTASMNSWVSATGTTIGTVTFTLPTSVSIDGFAFWNMNNLPAAAGATGIQGVTVTSSLDGVLFTPVVGAPTVFARELGPTSSAQRFSFDPIIARFVRFQILSNYGDLSRSGFAEIAFTNPEPGTVALFGLGAAGLGGLALRRRAARLKAASASRIR